MNTSSTAGPASVLRCQQCGARHDTASPLWACPCGGLLDVEITPALPWPELGRRPPGLWRYREALPLSPGAVPVSLGEPLTPLVVLPEPACRLMFKLDFLFPTGSFKDRGASVLMTKVKELGVSSVVEDSSGNAGTAVAAYAAAAGIAATIYVPAGAPPAKIKPIQLFGARLVQVPGSRSATSTAAWQEAQATYYASHVWNPYFLEGTKTVAFEIWEQLDRRAPDWVIAPVGHGTMLLGLAKGFAYLKEAGMIRQVPRLVGVQAAACAPLYAAFRQRSGRLPDMTAGTTQADGIAIARPVRWQQIIHAVDDSGGDIVTVDEVEITQTWQHWARRGLLMEPTSAAGPAAFSRLAQGGVFARNALVVVPITGAGFKTTDKYALGIRSKKPDRKRDQST